MLKEWLAVALGGMLGSLARYALMRAFLLIGAAWLPIATLSANLLGCLAMGWLAQWSLFHEHNNHWLVVGARVGLLGGLTTFSSFALDTFRMWHSGRAGMSVLLALTHVSCGILALLIGMSLAKQPPDEFLH